MATLSLVDSITVTGATSGQVIVEQSTFLSSLNATQRTALLAFLNTLSLPGTAANLTSVHVTRRRGTPNTLDAHVAGLIIPANATVALQNRASYDDIVGVVP